MIVIRSQKKKTLMSVEVVCISGHTTNDDGTTVDFLITGSTNTFEYRLGTYHTEERALEVLDEIQRYVDCGGKPIRVITDLRGRQIEEVRSSKIYEMPAE